jgi:hypothetical protein
MMIVLQGDHLRDSRLPSRRIRPLQRFLGRPRAYVLLVNLVRISQLTGGWLSVTPATAILIFSVPGQRGTVRHPTPAAQDRHRQHPRDRRLAPVGSVRLGYRAEDARACGGDAKRGMFGADAPHQSFRSGREINEHFTAALLLAGAVDPPATYVSDAAA